MTLTYRWRPNPAALPAIRDGAEAGLRLALEHVLGVSNARVPHEEGTLERSGMASVDGLRGAITYDTPYAVRQHEELEYRHDNGRQAKYLESAVNDERATSAKIIQTAIRRRIGT
jgi:hypothetical protein